ncbi:MAG TPA: sulfite exporter TauE/SafE family protein [Gemmatimonadales bacterium]
MTGIEFAEVLGVGFAAGIVGSLLGVGGGVVLVPGLSLLLGMPFREAVATSLVSVVATSVAGSIVYLRGGLIELPIAVELQFFTVIGAVGGGLMVAMVPEGPLHLAFAALLVYAGLSMMPTRRAESTRQVVRPARRGERSLAATASLGGGLVAGLLGVGGGIIFVPVIHLLLRRSFSVAAATSIYMIGITAGSGALVYLIRGDVVAPVTAVAVLGVLFGSTLAAHARGRIADRPLQVAFALLLFYVAFKMASHSVGNG